MKAKCIKCGAIKEIVCTVDGIHGVMSVLTKR